MRLVKVLAVLLVLAATAVGGAFFYYQRAIDTPLDPSATPKEVRVPKGASLSQTAKLLREEGLIADERLVRLYAKLNPGAPSPKAGRHRVSAAMKLPELLTELAKAPIPDDLPVTMVEGWRLRDADEWLAGKGMIATGSYLSAARDPSRFQIPFAMTGKDLEGYLLPETFMVPPDESGAAKIQVQVLVQRQIDAFAKRFLEPHAEEIKASGRSLSELVIMASLLEREEPDPATRPKVAGVLYRRLDAKTPLGVDATSRYTLDDWNDRQAFLKRLRDPADPYNTRLRAGLPPGPIGAPSLPSLLAALRPEKSDYWYYLHDAERRIHFARTAEEHEANRKRYNVW